MYSKYASTENITKFIEQYKCSMNQAILFLDLCKNNFQTACKSFEKSNVQKQDKQKIQYRSATEHTQIVVQKTTKDISNIQEKQPKPLKNKNQKENHQQMTTHPSANIQIMVINDLKRIRVLGRKQDKLKDIAKLFKKSKAFFQQQDVSERECLEMERKLIILQ